MWTKEWPTKPGMYWFYGFRFGKTESDQNPKLFFAQAFRTSNNKIAIIVDRQFVYMAEGAKGFWAKVDAPSIPEWLGDFLQ